ncbi:efflux RND transporter permease subunit, partial [Burkholderia sp. SIMBA_024]|uniref:efflux RND transporter permease subunit n=1 Tax=Burkholderia sp. SIMBA_024 TaxID=3085768 RepID=UPI00397C4046
GGNSVQVQLVGDSTQALQEIAEEVVPLLAQRKELRDVHIDNGDRTSELAIRVDRERAAAVGFSADEVARFVGLALRGSPIREFRRGDNEVPVWVRFAGAASTRPEDLESFTVRTK